MNDRQRFRLLLSGEPVDRPPLFEEGVRDEVLELWRKQGLPAGKTHLDLFGLVAHENLGPDLKFPSSYFGRVFDLSAAEYRVAFEPSAKRFPSDWSETVSRLEKRNHVVCIWASRGLFQALGVGDWATLESALIGTVREREKVRDRLEWYGEFCSRMLEATMPDVAPEFIYLSEPISDSDGPLISPDMFEEFMIPVYRGLVATAHDLGCKNVLLSTYGNTARLFPMLIEAGISMLWVSEAAERPELDYRNLRKQFGSEVGLIGGIPLSVLQTESNVELENRVDEIVSPLLASGRYIPLAGGRVREGISWSAYRRYREALRPLLV